MLKKLENVPGRRNAKAVSLENKKELRQLSLEWTSGKEEEQQCHELLESLERALKLILELCSPSICLFDISSFYLSQSIYNNIAYLYRQYNISVMVIFYHIDFCSLLCPLAKQQILSFFNLFYKITNAKCS
jgi:hypothetical protein